MQAGRWTTVDEEATRLSVHPETIRRWLKAGRIRGAKPGGHKLGWRIAPGEVERVLRAGADSRRPVSPAEDGR